MTPATQLRALIADHLSIDPESITETATFEQLGADSLDCVELSMLVEDQFGIEFESDELALDTFALEQTFGTGLGVVEAKLGARVSA